MASHRKVLIVGDTSLFTTGLTAWLTCEGCLQVSSVWFNDEAGLLHDVASVCPDVIVLGRGVSIEPTRLFELFATSPALNRAQLIAIHSDDNTLDVYEKRQVVVTQGSEFINLVQGGKIGTTIIE